MEEMPYASVVDDVNLSTICSNCFMKGGKLLCCANCKIVYYCSKVRNIHNNLIRSIYIDADYSHIYYIGMST